MLDFKRKFCWSVGDNTDRGKNGHRDLLFMCVQPNVNVLSTKIQLFSLSVHKLE